MLAAPDFEEINSTRRKLPRESGKWQVPAAYSVKSLGLQDGNRYFTDQSRSTGGLTPSKRPAIDVHLTASGHD